MYNRDITFSYFKMKFVKYFRFVLLWSIVIGMFESVFEQRFAVLDVFFGAWLGNGRLFHLWFITSILLLLGISCGIRYIAKRHLQKRLHLNAKWMITLVILMNALFIINTFFFHIGGVVIAPFRLLTNGGFYLLGMYLHSRKITAKPAFLIFASFAGYAGICMLSTTLSLEWASSMYASVFCVAGVLSAAVFCMQLKVTDHLVWRMVRYAAPASIGIWVTHPFAIAIGRKALEYVGVAITLPVRVVMVMAVFMLCLFGAKLALKIKGIRLWFQI